MNREDVSLGNESMIECLKCNADSAMYRATVWVCPSCGDILNAEQLFRLLENLEISKRLARRIRIEIAFKRMFSHYSLKSV